MTTATKADAAVAAAADAAATVADAAAAENVAAITIAAEADAAVVVAAAAAPQPRTASPSPAKRFSVPEPPRWRFLNEARKTAGYSSISAGMVVEGLSAEELAGKYQAPEWKLAREAAAGPNAEAAEVDDDYGVTMSKEERSIGKLRLGASEELEEKGLRKVFRGVEGEDGSRQEEQLDEWAQRNGKMSEIPRPHDPGPRQEEQVVKSAPLSGEMTEIPQFHNPGPWREEQVDELAPRNMEKPEILQLQDPRPWREEQVEELAPPNREMPKIAQLHEPRPLAAGELVILDGEKPEDPHLVLPDTDDATAEEHGLEGDGLSELGIEVLVDDMLGQVDREGIQEPAKEGLELTDTLPPSSAQSSNSSGQEPDKPTEDDSPSKRRWWVILLLVFLVAIIATVLGIMLGGKKRDDDESVSHVIDMADIFDIRAENATSITTPQTSSPMPPLDVATTTPPTPPNAMAAPMTGPPTVIPLSSAGASTISPTQGCPVGTKLFSVYNGNNNGSGNNSDNDINHDVSMKQQEEPHVMQPGEGHSSSMDVAIAWAVWEACTGEELLNCPPCPTGAGPQLSFDGGVSGCLPHDGQYVFEVWLPNNDGDAGSCCGLSMHSFVMTYNNAVVVRGELMSGKQAWWTDDNDGSAGDGRIHQQSFMGQMPFGASGWCPSSTPSFTRFNPPTPLPTKSPVSAPSSAPSYRPTPPTITLYPTLFPTSRPTESPTRKPTLSPTEKPTTRPTDGPSIDPTTSSPTNEPSLSIVETSSPTSTLTADPSPSPSITPPTDQPTCNNSNEDFNLCIAIDMSGSVCNQGTGFECEGCEPELICNDDGVDQGTCCTNFLNVIGFSSQLITALQSLPSDQSYSVVGFATSANLETSLESSEETLEALDELIYTGGKTNHADAIKTCKQSLGRNSRKGVMLLVTDGMPSEPQGASQATAEEAAAEAKSEGVFIITIMIESLSTTYIPQTISYLEGISSDGFAFYASNFSDLATLQESLLLQISCQV